MKLIIRIVLVLTASFIATMSFGQDIGPPSLAVGAGKVLYEKGSLDAELIASIITEKKAEVKQELAKRLILKKIGDGSYTLYYYTKNTIDLVFDVGNKDVVKKELLRNATELMVVLALSEIYLRLNSENKDGILQFKRSLNSAVSLFGEVSKEKFVKILAAKNIVLPSLIGINAYSIMDSLIDTRFKDLPLDEKDDLKVQVHKVLQKNNVKPSVKRSQIEGIRIRTNQIDMNIGAHRNISSSEGSYLEKPLILMRLKDHGKIEGSTITMDNLLLDVVFQACTENSYLQQKGLFQRYANLPERSVIDNYDIISRSNVPRIRQLYQSLDTIREEIGKLANFIGQYSYAISKLKIESSEYAEEKTLKDRVKIKDAVIGAYAKQTRKLIESLKIDTSCDECLAIVQDVTKLYTGDLLDNEADELQVLYYLQEELYPRLLGLNQDKNLKQLLFNITNISKELKDRTLLHLTISFLKDFPGSDKKEFIDFMYKIKRYGSQVVTIINNLDHAESYEKITKYIEDIGQLSPEPSGKIINSILNLHERYLTIESDSNRINIDVEGIYTDLYSKYADRAESNFGLYLSIGINNIVPLFKEADGTSMTTMSENQDTTAITFVGEKIGLKYKIWNSARKPYRKIRKPENRNLKAFIKKEQKPFVKDVYVFSYASGLLYQIDALTTDEKFNSVLFGTGFGTAFFNNLDANISYVFPSEAFEKGFINFSFDIKITEYLSELKKKKAENKMKDEQL